MELSGFQFVTVHAGKRTRTKTWVDADERRKVRVAVMRDYVRQKEDPTYKFSPATVSIDMKTHMDRFRPISKMGRRGNHSRNRPVTTRQQKHRPLAVKSSSEETERERSVLRIHTLGGIDPFGTFPVDLSDPQTLTLMEYYFKSYWSNSLAVNPNGTWTIVALKDEATIHAKLSLVAVHKADSTGEKLPSAYLRHRGHALRLIRKRLAEDGDNPSDELLGAVSILFSSDYHSNWPDEVLDHHALGFAALLQNKGGIDSPTMSKNISRIIAWMNLLHAAIREHPITIGRSSHAQEADVSEIVSLTGQLYTPSVAELTALQHLPSSIRDVFRQLRVLTEIKARLSTRRIPKLCEMFSDMLWKTEYDILELDRHNRDQRPFGYSGASIFDNRSAFAVLRDAFILYSYSALRDQNSISLFRRLSRRLEQYLFELVGTLQDLSAMPSSELALLLWVLYTGWKGATLAHEATSWFASQAVQICRVLMLSEEDRLTSHVKNLIWDAENDVGLFPILWDKLEDTRSKMSVL